MTITSKQKYVIAGTLVTISFVVGRFSAQKPEIKTAISAQTTTKQGRVKDTHIKTTVTIVKTPDGTVKTIKIIDQVEDIKTDTTSSKIINKITDVIPSKINVLNVSALIANDFSRGIFVPTYGISVNKEILGPITVGAFGLTNGVVGASIGLNL